MSEQERRDSGPGNADVLYLATCDLVVKGLNCGPEAIFLGRSAFGLNDSKQTQVPSPFIGQAGEKMDGETTWILVRQEVRTLGIGTGNACSWP